MQAHPVSWFVRVLWLALPFTVGDAIGHALADRSSHVALVATVIAWLGWTIGALALVTALPIALTAARIVGPAAAGVAAAAAWWGELDALSITGLALAVVAAVLSCSGWVADDHVDGPSYGEERRFSLRAPGPLLLGAIPLAWAITVAGAVAGPMLLAAHQWAVGAIVAVVGAALGAAAGRSLHTLSTRFVVFVPAGMTLVDPSSIIDAVLFPRTSILSFGPAPLEGERCDLSQQALGLALEVVTREPTQLTVRTGRRVAEERAARAVVFTPARPAAVLAEAAARNIATAEV
ncbi:MAG: hypothetical protein IT195_10990 [Microthrixaceae bacterium]|nr:hypothetical protein [Microthrixaceae bacterium]